MAEKFIIMAVKTGTTRGIILCVGSLEQGSRVFELLDTAVDLWFNCEEDYPEWLAPFMKIWDGCDILARSVTGTTTLRLVDNDWVPNTPEI